MSASDRSARLHHTDRQRTPGDRHRHRRHRGHKRRMPRHHPDIHSCRCPEPQCALRLGLFSNLINRQSRPSGKGSEWIFGSRITGHHRRSRRTDRHRARPNLLKYRCSHFRHQILRRRRSLQHRPRHTWRNYRSTTGHRFVKTGENSIGIDRFPRKRQPRRAACTLSRCNFR